MSYELTRDWKSAKDRCTAWMRDVAPMALATQPWQSNYNYLIRKKIFHVSYRFRIVTVESLGSVYWGIHSNTHVLELSSPIVNLPGFNVSIATNFGRKMDIVNNEL